MKMIKPAKIRMREQGLKNKVINKWHESMDIKQHLEKSIIMIMAVYECYFSREHRALSLRKQPEHKMKKTN